jgi:hypothetical protein
MMWSQKTPKYKTRARLSPQRANSQKESHHFYKRQAPQTRLCDGLKKHQF